MLKSVTIGARISPDLDKRLQRLADLTGRPKSWHLCEAVETYVLNEQEFISAVHEGLEDHQAGRLMTHESVKRHFERKHRKHARS